MSDDNDTTDETGKPTGPARPADGTTEKRDRPKLRAVVGRGRRRAKPPGGDTRFKPGNRVAAKGGVKRTPLGRLEQLDSIVRDTLRRVSIREYEDAGLSEGGKPKKRLIRIDPQSANAVANLVRVAMDLERQRAGEEMQKIMAELEQLRAIVGGMLAAR